MGPLTDQSAATPSAQECKCANGSGPNRARTNRKRISHLAQTFPRSIQLHNFPAFCRAEPSNVQSNSPEASQDVVIMSGVARSRGANRGNSPTVKEGSALIGLKI